MEEDYNEFELTELIKMAGRYFSYEEFVKDNPDLAEQVNQAFFYKACEGDTKERNVRELKRTYLKQPTEAYEEDLASRRNAVKQCIKIPIPIIMLSSKDLKKLQVVLLSSTLHSM